MILAIAGFELRRRLAMVSTYLYFAAFFALAFLLVIAAGGAFSSVSLGLGAGGKVLVSSPWSLNRYLSLLGYFGLLVTGSIAGQAAYQDFHEGAHPFFFTAPIREHQYLLGRFLGAMATTLLIFLSIGLGAWAGTRMPFVEHSLFGPNHLSAYVQPYLISVIPNLFFSGALFFSLAALTRRIAPVQVASVLLLVGYMIASALDSKLENRTLAALLDPFGMRAAARITEYWTIAEKNRQLIPFRGILLVNRLLWSAVGFATLGFTLWRFRFAHPNDGGRREAPQETPVKPAEISSPQAAPGRTEQLAELTWLAFRETVKNFNFAIMVLAGVLFMVVAAATMGSIYGTNTWPVTYQILDEVGNSFALFMIVLITFFSGELVWRERDARIDQLTDALPIPTWLPFVAKLAALILVQVLLLLVILVTGILIQTFKGYYHYQLALYLKELFGLRLIDYALLCVLAIFVQAVVNHKYVGHFVMVLYYLCITFMSDLGFEHHLYQYASSPNYTYSDMNGYGHFLRPVLCFDLYWAAFAFLLAIASRLFWVRGLESTFRLRRRLALARITPRLRISAAIAAAIFAGTGAYIFYNTNVLNHYRTEYQRNHILAEHERRYKKLEHLAQPRITDIDWSAELDPENRSLRARGEYQLVNKTEEPIKDIYVEVPADDDVEVRALAVAGQSQATRSDDEVGLRTFTLSQPLAPGAGCKLSFDVLYRQRGFPNGEGNTSLVGNGSFFASGVLPQIGYLAQGELSDDDARRKQGLKPRERMADADDGRARRDTYVSSDADWIRVTTTVSTSGDQLAIGPGVLEKQWQENGRRFFRYRTPNPVLPLFAVLSARYQVRRDHWNDVALEIDYQKGHEHNLDRMLAGMKKALEYCSVHFSPYQHKSLRIVEFPRYQKFAQSLPNTIPYSEAIGFIARVDSKKEDDIDYPFYVTAHEVAHQWWAHQVIGGNVQGSTMLSETLAQYSALMVMKHEFGADKMKRFLHYELDRYLLGRSFERKKEVPLSRVENQPYIHYQKGSLVMYALQDYLGEDAINQALAAYLKDVAYQAPPYTNSLELLSRFKAITPPDLKYLIEDLFETITLYDNRAEEAHVKKVGDKFEVRMILHSRKLRAGELGAEEERPLDDSIDIGVLGESGKVLLLEKRRIKGERSEITVTVSERPIKAGIDPLNKLIDRKPDDNTVKVQED